MSTTSAADSSVKPERYLGWLASHDVSDKIRLVDLIRSGIPYETVERSFDTLDLPLNTLWKTNALPRRTLQHAHKNERFASKPSEQVSRFLRVVLKTHNAFGDPKRAMAWLGRPTRALEGKAPFELLDTEEGARLVEELLGRIEHGLAQ